MTPQNNTWQERFDKQFQFAVKYKQKGREIIDFDYHKEEIERLKLFIQSELQRALQECLPGEKDTHGVTEPISVGDDRVAGIVNHGHNLCREQFIKNAKSRGIIIE
jgi:hypothetical protein